MIQIQTAYGPQQIDPDSLITFPQGLPGFDNCTRFKLFHQEDAKNPTVYWLQSVDQPEIMFSVADPSVMNVDYHFELNDEEMTLLQAKQPTDLLVLLLLYKSDQALGAAPQSASGETINAALRAPLVLNLQARLGLQKTLHHADISVLIKDKAIA